MARGGRRTGAGRPRRSSGGLSVSRSVTLTDREWAALREIAEKSGVTASGQVAAIVRAYLAGAAKGA